MSDESETPWDRAYRFALGTSSPSTVIVSFCFIKIYTYTCEIMQYTYTHLFMEDAGGDHPPLPSARRRNRSPFGDSHSAAAYKCLHLGDLGHLDIELAQPGCL